MNLFTLMGKVVVDTKGADKSLNKVESSATGLTKTFGKMAFGLVGIGGVTMALKKSVEESVEFEKRMTNVATLLDGDVNKRIEEMGKGVTDLAIQTGVSTDLLSDGLYQVVSAFGDTANSMKTLEIAAKGARAGNATVTDSVNLLSAVTKGYGDISEEATEKAADLAFQTVKLGQTTFPELAASIGKVIPLAVAMKVSQEELFGAMATLTGVTGNTAEVSTQLKGVIQGLLQPTKEMTEALQGLGFENGQAAIESEGLQGILQELKKEVGDDEVAFAGLFGSVEAKSAVLALAGEQAESFTEKTEAMTEATGQTEAAFEKQNETTDALIARTKELGLSILRGVGDTALPVLNKFLEVVLSLGPAFTKVFDIISWSVGNQLMLIVDLFRKVTDILKVFQDFAWKVDEFVRSIGRGISSFFKGENNFTVDEYRNFIPATLSGVGASTSNVSVSINTPAVVGRNAGDELASMVVDAIHRKGVNAI